MYTYQLSASGGATFALTTAPAGATLNGDTINWTPTASQSRMSNAFTVTATSSGGSAQQSWYVVTGGIIVVSQLDTYWTPSGPQQIPNQASTPQAIVPQPDGSVVLLAGTQVAPGVYNIAGVPAGYYWLALGSPITSVEGFWTQSSTVDLGRDIAGMPIGTTDNQQTTTFVFNLNGLDPALPPGVVGFTPDNLVSSFPLNLTPPAGSQTLTTSINVNSAADFTTMNTAFLMQYEPVSLSSSGNVTLNNLLLGPELGLSNLTLTNGGTNPITGTLSSSPQASLTLSIAGSQWLPLMNNIGPGPFAPSPVGSWLSIAAEPYVVGVNANPSPTGPNLFLVQSNPGNNVPLTGDPCPGTPLSVYAVPPTILTDQNFGTLQYGDPFPPAWTRAMSFCQQAVVQIPIGIAFLNFPLNFGAAVAPSNSPVAPLAFPVVNPTINGGSLYTAATLNTTVMTLSWDPSGPISPYGYTVYVLEESQSGGTFVLAEVGAYTTALPSVMLPPLLPDATYLFVITSNADGVANVETSPLRSQLPTGVASVVSAPITIPAGTMPPQLRGDAKLWQRLQHPQGERRRIAASN